MENDDVGTTVKGYTLMEFIGGGAFGRVYKSIRMDSPQFYAVKVVKKYVPSMSESKRKKFRMLLETEIQAMQMCNSSNVVRLIERFDTTSKIYIVLEFCDGPDLQKYMKDKGVLSEEEALMILRQLACGFQELQRNKIIHRDLKPANIFSNAGEFKIGDLGFARVLEKTTDLTKTMLGSLCYMAPEILRNRKYGFPVDVWSLGVVLHQMVIGKRPFGNPFIGDFDSMFECIEKTKLTFEDSKISEEMQELIQAMLTIDPQKRISWEHFYEHPLLKKEDLLVTTLMPVVRREPSKKGIQSDKLQKVYDDVFTNLMNQDDDGKDFEQPTGAKQIAMKINSAANVEQMRKHFIDVAELHKEFKKYTQQILFELGKLNLILKYLVVIEPQQLGQLINESRKLTELRLMCATRCIKKSWAITSYFSDQSSQIKKSEIASPRVPLFVFKFDEEYRKTLDFRNLQNQYRFIYEKSKKSFDWVSSRLEQFENKKSQIVLDFIKKHSDPESYKKKVEMMDGQEDYDYVEKEHTEYVMAYFHERKDRVDKFPPSKQLYVYLLVLSHYPELACFGGEQTAVARVKSEIQSNENSHISGEGWAKRIQEIKNKL